MVATMRTWCILIALVLFLSETAVAFYSKTHTKVLSDSSKFSTNANERNIIDQQFGLGRVAFSLLPLSPESIGKRKSLREEIIPGKVWTIDQLQGIINVNVPVRSTIIKLKAGGLFVHNPVAPTKECISLVRELESMYGPVKIIVLSTLGVEHKGTLGAFAAEFPSAEIFVQPDQYSFPINLPTQIFIPFGRNLRVIPTKSSDAPWKDDLDHACMKTLKAKSAGGYGETAFFHYETKTLLVTDSIVRIDDSPPAIIQDDPRALLYHARDTIDDIVVDSMETRKKGWRRMVLFGLTFQPSGIKIKSFQNAFNKLDKVPKEMSELGKGAIPFNQALYPWDWIKSEIPNFKALQGGLLVAPILRELIFNREPNDVIEWVNRVCRWDFQRIIPCHLSNNLKANKDDFRDAFDFLYEPTNLPNESDTFSFFNFKLFKFEVKSRARIPKCPQPMVEDLSVLKSASKALTVVGTLKNVAPLLKR